MLHRRGAGVACHAKHFALHSNTGVDGSHHAQRNIQGVEYRALLDMYFHKAQVVPRVAAQVCNVRRVMSGVQHGFAQGGSVCVLLAQPCRIKLAGERAGRQKGGLEALPFLLGKCHHFQRHGQATLLLVQPLHYCHGHINAQATVILAGVAHRVIVAARQQGSR